jgi:hypothetical protein
VDHGDIAAIAVTTASVGIAANVVTTVTMEQPGQAAE